MSPESQDSSSLDPEDEEQILWVWNRSRYFMERNKREAADWMDFTPMGRFFVAMTEGFDVEEPEGIETEDRDWIPFEPYR